jgi:hypothetical protein
MIRCAWCGAQNYAIDMWCARCQRHLDWQPVTRGRRRGGRALALLAPVAAGVAVAIALAMPAASWFNGTFVAGRSLPKTGAVPPAPSYQAQAPAPTPTPTPQPSATPAPTPIDSSTPAASAAPPVVTDTLPQSNPTPVVVPPAAPAVGDPLAAINRFYAEISAHQFADAASLWSARMQAQYPPVVYIDQRFSATQSIRLTGGQVITEGDGSAVVYVNVAELIGGQHRQWTGTWQLVASDSGWLLNSPNLRAG